MSEERYAYRFSVNNLWRKKLLRSMHKWKDKPETDLQGIKP
jgi:hypothetical protein